MSRLAKRPRADHKQTAQALRQQPGVWLPVNDYRSTGAAAGIVRDIRCAYSRHNRTSAYVPAGAFETRTELVEDGIRVYARYVGGAR